MDETINFALIKEDVTAKEIQNLNLKKLFQKLIYRLKY